MKSALDRLKKDIVTKKASIAVIGLGYVGLPLACEFAESGFSVTGIDLAKKKVDGVNKGKSHILDVESKRLKNLVKKRKRLKATTEFKVLSRCDVAIICVPTPLNRVKDPDISFILNAAKKIRKYIHKGTLIVLESTTYPGTTDEVLLPEFEESGLKVGKDIFLCFSPERVDPGNPDFQTGNIPKVVGGITKKCTELGSLLYSKMTSKVVKVSSARVAEMSKLLENTFRIVNIGMINELATIATSLGVDIWEAIRAASSKPFGYMPFYPGPGIGGHCIGIDPLYLSWRAKVQGFEIRFIELARQINSKMPTYIVEQAAHILNRQKKSVNKARVLVLGVTYKKDVKDVRESPAFDVINQLADLGAKVSYHDPYVSKVKYNGKSLKSVKLNASVLKQQDLVILTTNHSCFNYQYIAKYAELIFDTRNAFSGVKRYSKKIIKL